MADIPPLRRRIAMARMCSLFTRCTPHVCNANTMKRVPLLNFVCGHHPLLSFCLTILSFLSLRNCLHPLMVLFYSSAYMLETFLETLMTLRMQTSFPRSMLGLSLLLLARLSRFPIFGPHL